MKLIYQAKYREAYLTLLDLAIIISSYYFSIFIRCEFSFAASRGYFLSLHRVIHVALLINVLFCLLLRVNRSLWKYISVEEAIRVALAVVLSNTVLSLLNKTVLHLPRSIYAIATLISISAMLGIRIIYRYYRQTVKQAARSKRAIIIGAGDAGNILSKEIVTNDHYACRIVGFVDDDPYKNGRIINGYTVLGSTVQLPVIAEKKAIDIAYIAIPSASRDDIKRIVQLCQSIPLEVKIMGINEVDQRGRTKLRDVSLEDLLGRGEIHLDNSGIASYLTNRVIMVTGAGGSIGSELCRQILKFHPKKLIMLDIYENCLYDLQMEFEMKDRNRDEYRNTEKEYIISSVRDRIRIYQIIREEAPDVVYHAAAHKHVPLMETVPIEAIKNNIFGTRNVIQACIDNNVSKFILISTDKAVHPTNVMGATKRMTELMVQSLRNNGTTTLAAVRFGNVLGSNGSVIPLFKKQIVAGGPVTVTDPEIKRYFMTIPEASQLVLQAGAYAQNGEVFVLDMGEPVKILTLAENMIRLSGYKPYEDIPIQFTGLRPGEKMYEELILDKKRFHKTDNQLIFVAEPEKVEKNKYEKELNQLWEAVTNNSDSLKEMILTMIDLDYSNG